jgi:hypothetical protein
LADVRAIKEITNVCSHVEELLTFGGVMKGRYASDDGWTLRSACAGLRWLGIHRVSRYDVQEVIESSPWESPRRAAVHFNGQLSPYVREPSVDELVPILDGRACPGLREVGIASYPETEAVLRVLARSPSLRRVERLAIRAARLRNERTLRVLEDNADAFRHVRFIVPHTELDTATALGDVLRTKLGRPRDAAEIYRARIRRAPDDVQAGVGLGLALLDLEAHDEAIATRARARASRHRQTLGTVSISRISRRGRRWRDRESDAGGGDSVSQRVVMEPARGATRSRGPRRPSTRSPPPHASRSMF